MSIRFGCDFCMKSFSFPFVIRLDLSERKSDDPDDIKSSYKTMDICKDCAESKNFPLPEKLIVTYKQMDDDQNWNEGYPIEDVSYD